MTNTNPTPRPRTRTQITDSFIRDRDLIHTLPISRRAKRRLENDRHAEYAAAWENAPQKIAF